MSEHNPPPNFATVYGDGIADTDTKPAITHSFTVDGQQGYVTVGLDDNKQPCEMFITIQKEGSTVGGFADALARLVSTALQGGIPMATICRRMKGLRFTPNGLTTNEHIPTTESIVDYIFSWIEYTFHP